MQSSFTISEASVLIDLTSKSTKKLMNAPPAIVALGPCSTAIHVATTLELKYCERAC